MEVGGIRVREVDYGYTSKKSATRPESHREAGKTGELEGKSLTCPHFPVLLGEGILLNMK